MKVIKEIVEEYKALFKLLKERKKNRNEYRIKPSIEFICDRNIFAFSILPVIVWEPWIYRYPNMWVVDIWWFNFHICIGIWEVK